jgi:hypothetical protein
MPARYQSIWSSYYRKERHFSFQDDFNIDEIDRLRLFSIYWRNWKWYRKCFPLFRTDRDLMHGLYISRFDSFISLHNEGFSRDWIRHSRLLSYKKPQILRRIASLYTDESHSSKWFYVTGQFSLRLASRQFTKKMNIKFSCYLKRRNVC